MPEELRLPMLAVAALLWYLLRALRQTRSARASAPTIVWREAGDHHWSDWTELDGVAASARYDDMLAEVRSRAFSGATAVQFAVVVQPADAPDYTLRVLFMSAIRDRVAPRELVDASCTGTVRNG